MSDETQGIFARLEIVDRRQILAEVQKSDDGPVVRVRRDMAIIIEEIAGPWPDTEDGWDRASDYLFALDLQTTARNMDRFKASFSQPDGHDEVPT